MAETRKRNHTGRNATNIGEKLDRLREANSKHIVFPTVGRCDCDNCREYFAEILQRDKERSAALAAKQSRTEAKRFRFEIIGNRQFTVFDTQRNEVIGSAIGVGRTWNVVTLVGSSLNWGWKTRELAAEYLAQLPKVDASKEDKPKKLARAA